MVLDEWSNGDPMKISLRQRYSYTAHVAIFRILFLLLTFLTLAGCSSPKVGGAQLYGEKENLTRGELAALQILVALVMLVCLIALIIPGFPGITFIWLAALIYGLVVGFEKPAGTFMGIISGLMILGNIVDNLLMGAAVRKSGASWRTTLFTILAAVVGSLLWPPFGGIILAVIVLFILEFNRVKNSETAFRSTGELIKGFGCSFFVRILIGMTMIGLWIAWLVQTDQWLL